MQYKCISIRCKSLEEKFKPTFAKKKSLSVGQGDVTVEIVEKKLMDKFKIEKYWSDGIRVDPKDVNIRIFVKKQSSGDDKWEEELKDAKSVVGFVLDKESEQTSKSINIT